MENLELICSTTGEGLGIAVPRHAALRAQVWCRSTNIYVLNHKGEVLVHQRSMQKERMPGVWVTHLGGHVGEGENYETNALKELEEEVKRLIEENNFIKSNNINYCRQINVKNLYIYFIFIFF